MKRKKSTTQEALERFFQVNQEVKTPKKSKFQQRLDDMVKKNKERTSPGKYGPTDISLHNEETPPGETGPTKISLHDKDNPVQWISVLYEKPPYYTSVDLLHDRGTVILEDWARVSHGGEVDGQDDFYVNNRNSDVVYDVTHWRKRPEVKYKPYEPMTTNDIPILSTNDVNEALKTLEELKTVWGVNTNNPYIEYYNSAIEDCIAVVQNTLKVKTKSTILRTDTSICKTGGLIKSKK
jgi:hypothetical protein